MSSACFHFRRGAAKVSDTSTPRASKNVPSMSRVRWASAARRLHFDFTHTPNGRLHADELAGSVSHVWPRAVCGSKEFICQAVPALRTAGKHVAAISVLPAEGQQDIRSRLRAQDEQDRLVSKLGIESGLAVEAFHKQKEFEHVLVESCDSHALPTALLESRKTLVHAPPVSSLADLRQLIVTGALDLGTAENGQTASR
jgi:hypothetical protein